jgi:hypothetical protein
LEIARERADTAKKAAAILKAATEAKADHPYLIRKRVRLTDARGVRRELAALYAEFRNGAVDAEQAKTGGFLLRCLLESIRCDELETRLAKLEDQTR